MFKLVLIVFFYQNSLCRLTVGMVYSKYQELKTHTESSVIQTNTKEIISWLSYLVATAPFHEARHTYFPLLINNYAKSIVNENCTIDFLVFGVNPGSVATYTLSLSIILLCIVCFLFGGAADFGYVRKLFLFLASALASMAITSVAFFPKPEWLLWICVVYIFGVPMYGLSRVYFYGYLSLIVTSHPHVINANLKEVALKKISNLFSAVATITTGIFSAVFLGAFIGVTYLLSGNDVVLLDSSCFDERKSYSTDAYRLIIFISGISWLLVGSIGILCLHPRKGKSLPMLKSGKKMNHFSASVKTTVDTFKSAKQIPNLLLIILAFFIAANGYNSMNSVTFLLMANELAIEPLIMSLLIFIIAMGAIAGATVSSQIINSCHIPPRTVIWSAQIVNILLCIYIFLGHFDFPLGLKKDQEFELFIYAVTFGILFGVFDTHFRTMFLPLVPRQYESEFFSFLLIAEYSDWIGPLLAGIIHQATGTFRWAYLVFIILTFFSMILLFFVDEKKGVIERDIFNTENSTSSGTSESHNNKSESSCIVADATNGGFQTKGGHDPDYYPFGPPTRIPQRNPSTHPTTSSTN